MSAHIPSLRRIGTSLLVIAACLSSSAFAQDTAPPDFNAEVAPILQKYCTGCHNEREANGELQLNTFEQVLAGGDSGPAVVAGKADASRLIALVEGRDEPRMPPEGSRGPTAEELAVIKAWINGGAKKPTAPLIRRLTGVPEIGLTAPVRRAITAVAHSADGRWLAVARYGSVDVFTAADQKPVATVSGMTGNVNDVGFSDDGALLYAASGEPGLYGQLTLVRTADWQTARVIEGHSDSLYTADLSPDGTLLATGGYDQSILLWDAATGQQLHELTGHNGPIFDLEFHPHLPLLASASGDRTVKLWDVDSGARLDTLIEPEKEQYTLAFTPDGKRLAAAGVDRRIRVWRLTREGQEGTNPIQYTRFAHEKPILRLQFSADGRVLASSSEDRVIKFWEARDITQTGVLEQQPDWPSGLSFARDHSHLVVGRMDGTLTRYPVEDRYRSNASPLEPVALVGAPEVIPEAPTEMATTAEAEPNDELSQAQPLTLPATVDGTLVAAAGRSEDADLYRFTARGGESWIIETNAQRQQSPADTLVEVLTADGEPVLRYLLRAVRESYINFRGVGSEELQVRVENWEEMGLDQYLFMNGEVGRVIRMPLGPDSGLLLYDVSGKRRAYFDTTATAHPFEETVYIVEAYPPGTVLPDNGLPVFPLHFANDDDGRRKLGKDSRLTFTAPADGEYLLRVRDVRGFGGAEYKYTLTVRPPRPDFSVSVGGAGATIEPGSGVKLTFTADRQDDFEGEIRITVNGLPDGYTCSTPLTIQEGHLTAEAVLTADADAAAHPNEVWEQVQVTATADILGETVERAAGNLGHVKLGEAPIAILHLELPPDAAPGAGDLVIEPGTRIRAWLRVERFGFDGELRCNLHNLPHGVIVDDIGLSGVMIREGETERMIFLSAADWVPETSRAVFADASGSHTEKVKDPETGKEKNQTRSVAPNSRPVLLRVARPGQVASRSQD